MARSVEVAGIRLVWHTLVPGRPPHGLGLFVPENPNDVLESFTDEEFVESDERMPYFSTLWPSAESLTRELLRVPEAWNGQRVLDLGCGVGAVGLAAARRGAAVTFLDWEPRALEITRRSVAALDIPDAEYVAADWREYAPDLPFEKILAADVLYEARNIPGVARFLGKALRPGGEAWIADPGRNHAKDFPVAARASGLTVLDPFVLPALDHGHQVTVLRVQRPRESMSAK